MVGCGLIGVGCWLFVNVLLCLVCVVCCWVRSLFRLCLSFDVGCVVCVCYVLWWCYCVWVCLLCVSVVFIVFVVCIFVW